MDAAQSACSDSFKIYQSLLFTVFPISTATDWHKGEGRDGGGGKEGGGRKRGRRRGSFPMRSGARCQPNCNEGFDLREKEKKG